MSKVFNTKLNDAEPLENQIDKFLRTIQTINSLSHPFDDHLAAVSLINAIPSTLSTLKTILSDSQSKVTSAEVKQRILIDEQRRILDSGSSATAFFARAGKKPQRGDKCDKRERRDKFDPSKHCDFCEIDGHDVLVCRKAKRALEESKAGKKGTKSKPKNKKASASIAVADEEEESDSDNKTVYSTTDTAVAMVSVADHSTIGNQWILDSSASRNMCSNRDWFFQFTPLSSPVNVVLADDHCHRHGRDTRLRRSAGSRAFLGRGMGQYSRCTPERERQGLDCETRRLDLAS